MMLFFISALFSLSAAQFNQECIYNFGPNQLNLYSLKGQRHIYHSADNTEWMYSICSNNLPCSHDNVEVDAMIDHSPVGINECFPWAVNDLTVQPFFDLQIGSWIFNYSNGEPCPDGSQINRTTQILWTCDEDRGDPAMVDAFNYNTCNVMIEMKWAGACGPAPPPNQECEFRSGFTSLNLSTIKGTTLSLTETSNNGNKFTYEYTPCANSLSCLMKNGQSYNVMADIRDDGMGCAKYLGVWSGDNQPFYDRTVFGQDYWDFFWMDGEQCGEGGPLEVLNVRYYCNPKIDGGNITRAYSNGPCQFRIEIDSKLACGNMTNTIETY